MGTGLLSFSSSSWHSCVCALSVSSLICNETAIRQMGRVFCEKFPEIWTGPEGKSLDWFRRSIERCTDIQEVLGFVPDGRTLANSRVECRSNTTKVGLYEEPKSHTVQ